MNIYLFFCLFKHFLAPIMKFSLFFFLYIFFIFLLFLLLMLLLLLLSYTSLFVYTLPCKNSCVLWQIFLLFTNKQFICLGTPWRMSNRKKQNINEQSIWILRHNACHSYRHMYMCVHVLMYAAYTCVPCVKLSHAFGNSWNVHTSGSGVYELALYLLNSHVCFNCVFFLNFGSLVDFFKLVVIILFDLCNVVAIRLRVPSKLWIFLWYKQFWFGYILFHKF